MQQQSVVKNSIDFLPKVSRLFSSGGKIESNTFRLAPALNLVLDCKSVPGTERLLPVISPPVCLCEAEHEVSEAWWHQLLCVCASFKNQSTD